MSDSDSKVKKQRDQFLAFAFASSDLFLEISESGKITFALGASKGMTGITDKEMLGMNWLNLFSTYDQAQLMDMAENARLGKRWGPILVDLNEEIIKRKGVVTGIKMPGSSSSFVTLGLSNELMAKLASAPPNRNKDLADVSQFIEEAQGAMEFARSLGDDAAITLFDFGFTEGIEEEFGPENWGSFQEDLRDLMQANGLNGSNPGKFSDSAFALTHSVDMDVEAFKHELTRLIEEYIPDGTTGYIPDAHTVIADLEELSEWDTEKSLEYLVTGFVAKDEEAPEYKIEKLSGSISCFAVNNKSKIKQLMEIIERVDFSLKFTPVINLAENKTAYNEIIPVFKKGTRREWMMLAEDIGVGAKFDEAYCGRAVNHIVFKAGGSRSKFATALFTQSTENEEFLEEINALYEKHKSDAISDRLCLQITNSQQLTAKMQTILFLKTVSKHGFKIILDDVFLNAQTKQNIDRYPISGLKLSEKYTSLILNDKRARASIEKLVAICKRKNITVACKNVTTAKQAQRLKEIGIDYAQGPLYGISLDSANYQPP